MSREIPQPGETEETQLPLNEAKKLFWNANYFSQGNVNLQRQIYRFYHQLNPHVILDEKTRKKMADSIWLAVESASASGSFVFPKHNFSDEPLYRDKESRRVDILCRSFDMWTALMPTSRFTDTGHTVRGLSSAIIQQDYKFLVDRSGRSRNNGENKKEDYRTDPWLSHICHFALAGTSTGSDFFDIMFFEIGRYLRTEEAREFIGNGVANEELNVEKLREVIRVYNEHHTNSRVEW